MYVRGFADVVAASNLSIGLLLIILSLIIDFHSARKVLLGDFVLMSFFLIVGFFNKINAGIIVDAGPPTLFWFFLIANIYWCTYGLLKGKNC